MLENRKSHWLHSGWQANTRMRVSVSGGASWHFTTWKDEILMKFHWKSIISVENDETKQRHLLKIHRHQLTLTSESFPLIRYTCVWQLIHVPALVAMCRWVSVHAATNVITHNISTSASVFEHRLRCSNTSHFFSSSFIQYRVLRCSHIYTAIRILMFICMLELSRKKISKKLYKVSSEIVMCRFDSLLLL